MALVSEPLPPRAVRSQGHVYWLRIVPDLMREWEWSERYPGQPEIMGYLNHVADRFDLKRDILFNARVMAAHYDEIVNRWRVRTDRGATSPQTS